MIGQERGTAPVKERDRRDAGLCKAQVLFTVICDQKAKSVYEIIDSRKTEAVSPWFGENKAILHNVETTAMDISAGYAAFCFDKFHVVQIMNKAVDATRKEEQKSLPDFEPAFKKWYWWATHSRLEAVKKAA